MRTRAEHWALPLAFFAGIVGCATQAPAPKPAAVDTAAMGASLDSLNKAFIAAVAARDTEAVVGLYADDAHLMPPNMPRADGHDAIRGVWVGFFKTPGLELNLTASQPMFAEAGDMIVDIGGYSMKSMDKKGKPMEDVGKYVTIFKKVDGNWKIAVDTFNSDKPAPGM
jgi:uncharacterized protein (TIGR02246 family)